MTFLRAMGLLDAIIGVWFGAFQKEYARGAFWIALACYALVAHVIQDGVKRG